MIITTMMMMKTSRRCQYGWCVCVRRVEVVLRIYRFHHQVGTTGGGLPYTLVVGVVIFSRSVFPCYSFTTKSKQQVGAFLTL